MTSPVDVWVVGAGFAGRAAVAQARGAGASVAWTAHTPAASLFWSGLGELHGPTAPWPAAQSAHRLLREAHRPQPPVRDADSRRALLSAALPAHPLLRSGPSGAALGNEVARLCGAMGIAWEGSAAPRWFLTDAATVRLADGHTEGLCALDRSTRYAVVGWSALGTFDASWCARAAQTAGFRVVPRQLAPPSTSFQTLAALQGSGAAAALRASGALAQVDVEEVDVVLVPPWFSREPDDAAAERGRWSEALRRPVFELAGTVDSPFGARALAASSRADAIGAPAVEDAAPEYREGVWTSGSVRARTLVLATGGPLNRPAFADEWGPEALPLAEATARSPWRPQPFLAAGVEVDATLRSMRAPGPCWVAGAALDGHDPAHDGTGFGTAIWSGGAAGAAAAAFAQGES